MIASLSQMHDPTCLESDREASVCEVLRETRDLHALVVEGRGRGTGVKGRAQLNPLGNEAREAQV